MDNGVGVFGALGVLFVGLKLMDIIAWSWWWVLLPFYAWIPILFIVVFIAAATAYYKQT